MLISIRAVGVGGSLLGALLCGLSSCRRSHESVSRTLASNRCWVAAGPAIDSATAIRAAGQALYGRIGFKVLYRVREMRREDAGYLISLSAIDPPGSRIVEGDGTVRVCDDGSATVGAGDTSKARRPSFGA